MASWSGARLEGLGWGVGVLQGGGCFGGRWVGGRGGWWVGAFGSPGCGRGVGRFRSGAGCCRYSPVARFRIWACGGGGVGGGCFRGGGGGGLVGGGGGGGFWGGGGGGGVVRGRSRGVG